MNIHEIHDLSNQPIVDLLKNGLSEITDQRFIKNYHPDYQHTPGNLFHILEQGRYRKNHGKYFVMTDEHDKYVCSAGWNEYDLDSTLALLLTRMYITPQHRSRYMIGKMILPKMISEAGEYSRLWITANEHNRSIYTYFERVSQNKRPVLFNDWPDIYKQFKPIGKKTIYYTEQWIAEYDKKTDN